MSAQTCRVLASYLRTANRRPGGLILLAFTSTLFLALLSPANALAQGTRNDQSGNGPASDVPYDHATMAPTLMAYPLTEEIQVDGRLDEGIWQTVEPFTDFIQREPNEGEPASERTEVRVLVGPDALYIGGRFFDR